MDLTTAYQDLAQLMPEERVATAFYQEYHAPLHLLYVWHFMGECPEGTTHFNFRYVFSKAGQKALRDYNNYISSRSSPHDVHLLSEMQFLADGYDIRVAKYAQCVTWPLMKHDFFELIYPLQNACTVTIEQQQFTLPQQEILIIPPHMKHAVFVEPDSLVLGIQIRRSSFDQVFMNMLQEESALARFFTQILYSRNYRNYLLFHTKQDVCLVYLILSMAAQQRERKKFTNNVLGNLLGALLSYIMQNFEDHMELRTASPTSNETIANIVDYIVDHYQNATLQETADHFYLNPSYLSTFIKRQTGSTFSNILQEAKIKRSLELLLHTDLKINDICTIVGYKDTTQFIRTFRKYYGCTPARYRNQRGDFE